MLERRQLHNFVVKNKAKAKTAEMLEFEQIFATFNTYIN